MKRILLLFGLAICVIGKAQVSTFKAVNNKWNVSIGGGYIPDAKTGLVMLSTTLKGIHLTIGGLWAEHVSDVRVGKWEDKACFIFRAGYQLPIVKSVRLIPVVGVTGAGKALIDGYNYHVSSNGIHNDVDYDLNYKFDYGGHLVLNPHKGLIISLAATRYSLYGSIGFEW